MQHQLPFFPNQAQLLTYLKLLDKVKGTLINFNCTNIYKEGQKTMATAKFAALND